VLWEPGNYQAKEDSVDTQLTRDMIDTYFAAKGCAAGSHSYGPDYAGLAEVRTNSGCSSKSGKNMLTPRGPRFRRTVLTGRTR
jgi:hypothetical protein